MASIGRHDFNDTPLFSSGCRPSRLDDSHGTPRPRSTSCHGFNRTVRSSRRYDGLHRLPPVRMGVQRCSWLACGRPRFLRRSVRVSAQTTPRWRESDGRQFLPGGCGTTVHEVPMHALHSTCVQVGVHRRCVFQIQHGGGPLGHGQMHRMPLLHGRLPVPDSGVSIRSGAPARHHEVRFLCASRTARMRGDLSGGGHDVWSAFRVDPPGS